MFGNMDALQAAASSAPMAYGLRPVGFKPSGSMDPGAVDAQAAQQAEADNQAAVLAAHNSIYDNYNPIRVHRALDMLEAVPDLNRADQLSMAAMLLSNVLLHTDPDARMNVIAGTVSCAGSLLSNALQGEPGTFAAGVPVGQKPKPADLPG